MHDARAMIARMRSTKHRLAFIAASCLFLAGSAIANGCSGDDSITASDDASTPFDGTTTDGGPPNDAASNDASSDASSDAGVVRPHIVFATSTNFTGDL